MTEISFVVPAWNEADSIPGCLGAIHAAARSAALDYEVIVVDDGSDDGTGDLARERGARVLRIARRQIAAARNAGAREARGRFLIFIDADTVVTPAAVASAVSALRGGASFGGGSMIWDEQTRLAYRFGMNAVLLSLRMTRMAAGAFLFCTTEAFRTVGGFDESLFACEEIFLSRALRKTGRFAWVREPVVTSARKIRTHGFWELMKSSAFIFLGGFGALRSRRRLDLWYGDRRPDPASRSHGAV